MATSHIETAEYLIALAEQHQSDSVTVDLKTMKPRSYHGGYSVYRSEKKEIIEACDFSGELSLKLSEWLESVLSKPHGPRCLALAIEPSTPDQRLLYLATFDHFADIANAKACARAHGQSKIFHAQIPTFFAAA